MKSSTTQVIDNQEDQQFEMRLDKGIALLTYRWLDDRTLALEHTEVPQALEGQGVGSALVENALALIEDRQLKIVPYCPFVTLFLQKHPDWKRLQL